MRNAGIRVLTWAANLPLVGKLLSIVAIKVTVWRFIRMDRKLRRTILTDQSKLRLTSRRSRWANEDLLGELALVIFLITVIALGGIVMAIFI